MNKVDVQLLQQMRGYPSVSLIIPTHRTSPDNRQDPIRVKNLVTETKNRLQQEFSKREMSKVLNNLDKIVEEIDYAYALDGLAIFVNEDSARKYYLPFSVEERVVIDETFATRDLVFAMKRSVRYWVVVLSEQPTRLYEGTRETLIEVTEHGFPMTHILPGGEAQLPGGAGVNASAYRDERHRQFFRDVDANITKMLRADDLPLAVVGVNRFISFYDELTQNKNAIIARLEGSHDKTSAYELGQLIWPEVKKGLTEIRQKVLKDLDAAVGARRFVSTLGEVWRYAHDGRGDTLVIEQGYFQPVTVSEDGRHITPVDDPTVPGVIDDAIDEIIEAVIAKGGQVRFVDDGTLKDHQRIALITRY